MISKRMLIVVVLCLIMAINIIAFSFTESKTSSPGGISRFALFWVSPFQEAATGTMRFLQGVWRHYFFLVSVSKENAVLKKNIQEAVEKNTHCEEIALSNSRLRNLLNFKETQIDRVVAAEIIGMDPSPWFRTIIIDKGASDGFRKGLPVVVAEGIVGQIIDVASYYSKVLLIVDRNSAVDALVQRSRARGIAKGLSSDQCQFNYVLRKHDIRVGDTVISSGMDGVYPKGLRIGLVADVVKRNTGIFQEVTINPFVDFERLEEVLIILKKPINKLTSLP